MNSPDPNDGRPNLSRLVAQRADEWEKGWELASIRRELFSTAGRDCAVELGRAPLPTRYGNWTLIVFGDIPTGEQHSVLVFGDIASQSSNFFENVLVRLHSACHTSEVFGATNCECKSELDLAMQQIRAEGCGIIIYLEQEGRGTGLRGKVKQLDRMFSWAEDGSIEQRRDSDGIPVDTYSAYKEAGLPPEIRNFEIAGEILTQLGVNSCRLMSNNPLKSDGIRSRGIKVTEVEIHIPPENNLIAVDLESKARKLGHKIEPAHYQFP